MPTTGLRAFNLGLHPLTGNVRGVTIHRHWSLLECPFYSDKVGWLDNV